jgi:hypothetical protein
LKQCNGSSVIATKSCKGSEEGLGLSFHWNAFGIEEMDEEKMVTSSFGGAALGISQVGTPT